MRHTKIVATLGPASRSPEVLDALIAAGVDVVRLNFSHGSHEQHAENFRRVREAAQRAGRHVAIMQDLSGPKIRTGALQDGRPIPLEPGDLLEIATGDFVGGPGRVSTTYAELARAVQPGNRLLLDDGKIELEVLATDGTTIRTEVIDGGELSEHKGINAPLVPLPPAGLTLKDAQDLAFGLELGVDAAALSFVQSSQDVARARQLTADAGRPDFPLVAKLERPEALARLDEIIAASDAVMVARGDLGLEIPLEQVPRIQKEILRRASAFGVPVIVATQVLESMRTEYRPTRAEVSDAAGAVDGGADAIMLSGETAGGQYPGRSVEVLDAIIRDAEKGGPADRRPADSDHAPALADAAVTLATRARADAIVAVTRKGRTARLLSGRRPPMPVFAVTHREDVARRLSIWRGVRAVVMPLEGDADSVASGAVERLRAEGLLAADQVVVVSNVSRDLTREAANFLRIRRA